eukprot:2655704-Pyramimonas_sp.AAC.1
MLQVAVSRDWSRQRSIEMSALLRKPGACSDCWMLAGMSEDAKMPETKVGSSDPAREKKASSVPTDGLNDAGAVACPRRSRKCRACPL